MARLYIDVELSSWRIGDVWRTSPPRPGSRPTKESPPQWPSPWMSRLVTRRRSSVRSRLSGVNTIFNLLTADAQIQCFENAARHLSDGGAHLPHDVSTALASPGASTTSWSAPIASVPPTRYLVSAIPIDTSGHLPATLTRQFTVTNAHRAPAHHPTTEVDDRYLPDRHLRPRLDAVTPFTTIACGWRGGGAS